MPTLGEELKQKREEQGITLAEIAESTRIGTRFLKAIEEGNFSTLPGGIFTRSFIRAYAKKVGMDEDEAITLYHRQTSDEPIPAPIAQDGNNNGNVEHVPQALPVASPILKYETERRGPSWTAVIVVALVLLAIGGVAGALFMRSNGEGAKTADASSPSKSKPGQAGQGQPTSTPAQAASVSTSLPAPGQPIDITLEATNGESWVRYQVDQGQTSTLILKPGESKSLPPAHDEIKLSFGNRTTLKLKIDNRDANFPAGTPNFAAQVVISHDNLHNYIPN